MWRRPLLPVVALVMAIIVALPMRAQQKPFTQDQVQAMVRDGLADETGAKAIAQRGIDFAPTEEFIQTLKAAGASEAFLAALRATKHPETESIIIQLQVSRANELCKSTHGQGVDRKMCDVLLARNWSKRRVLECLESERKFELVRFLEERYSERFFKPIRCLREAAGNEQGYGFAIMALCCLLIETIQCYRQGLPSLSKEDLDFMEGSDLNSNAPQDYKLVPPWPFKKGSEDAFVNFFSELKHQQYLPGVEGVEFYKKVRCGLLHQAQTKGTWRLSRTGKFWNPSEKSINRDEFAQRLEECFGDYLKQLKEVNWNDPSWMSAGKKIWWLAKTS